MRLIDGDKLLEVIAEQERWNVPDFVYESIKNAPTIDAEPIIRCKDCKFNYANQILSGEGCQLCVELPVSKDFFCAYGEKEC